MSDRICESLGCAMYNLAKNSLYYTTYAAGYIGGSIPSGIAKGIEATRHGFNNAFALLADTDASGNRTGLLYHPVTQAAGVALAGFGIGYAGYKLIKGQPLLIQRAWAQVNGRHHIQLPPLSAFLRAAGGAAMIAAGTFMAANAFIYGTWGVGKAEPSADCGKIR
jgi:hypothetical protein